MQVSSSMMKEIEYHPGRKALLVMFNDGKIWEYQNVRPEIWELFTEIIASNRLPNATGVSLGRAFHYIIRIHPNLYPGIRRAELTTCNFAVITREEVDGTNG